MPRLRRSERQSGLSAAADRFAKVERRRKARELQDYRGSILGIIGNGENSDSLRTAKPILFAVFAGFGGHAKYRVRDR